MAGKEQEVRPAVLVDGNVLNTSDRPRACRLRWHLRLEMLPLAIC
jgi:hypothetical protein